MDYNTYKNYILESVEFYTANVKSKIVKNLVSSGIITTNEQCDLLAPNAHFIKATDEECIFVKCLEEKPEAIKFIEKWDFIKSYKYSVLFKINSIPSSSFIGELVSRSEILAFSNLIDTNNINTFDQIFPIPEKPVYFEDEDRIYFKFNISKNHTDVDGNDHSYKYTALIVIHEGINVLEMRFNPISSDGKNSRMYYVSLIHQIWDWIIQKLGIDLQDFEMEDILENIENKIKAHEITDYIIAGKSSIYRNGGQAELNVGFGQMTLLPLLGELQEIIDKYMIELDKVPELKECLLDFMHDYVDEATDMWIKLRKIDADKAKDYDIKFTYRYLMEGYCLVQHYQINSIIGMERMNDVTCFLEQNR